MILASTYDGNLTTFRVSGLSDSHSSNKAYVWVCVCCLLSGMHVLGTESHINVWYITSLMPASHRPEMVARWLHEV